MNTHTNTIEREQNCDRARRFTASGMPVIRIPQSVYKTIAAELIDHIDGRQSYEVKVERDNGTFGWEYSIKFCVNYDMDRRPDGDILVFREVAPTWAEFHVWFSDEGDDLQNDFEAEKLRNYGIPYNKPFTTTGVRTGTQRVSHP